MASSSKQKGSCAYCQSETSEFMNAWKLRDGGFAKLCETCGTLYEKGIFCVKFHSDSDGWRNCLICGKLVHCGCIMSYHMYETLDFGGLSCTGCARESAILEANQYSFFTNAPSKFTRDLSDSLEAERSVDPGETKSGIGESPDSSVNCPLPIETTHQSISAGSSSHGNSPLARFGEQTKSSLNGAGKTTDPSVGKQTALQSVLFEAPSQAQSSAAHLEEQNKNSQIGSDAPVNPVLGTQTSCENVVAGSLSQIQSPMAQTGEENKNSLNGEQTPADRFVGNQTSAAHLGEQNKNSQIGSGAPVNPVLGTQTSCQNVVAGSLSGEENKSSLNGEQTPADCLVGNQTSEGKTSANVTSPPSSLPVVTDNVLPRSSEDSNSVLDLLFVKFLSVADIKSKTTRLVLPTICAQAFFPSIVEGQRLPLRFQDISGTDWKFTFCVRRSNNNKTYVLQGVRRYRQEMKWKYGDRVAFYRRGSDGKFVIETKKVSSDSNAP